MRNLLPFFSLLLTLTVHGQDTTSIKKDSLSWDQYHAIQAKLDSVFTVDQGIRKDYEIVLKKYGPNARQMDSLTKLMLKMDAGNGAIVKEVLDHYGWLGIDEIGEKANLTLFLVIQHSNMATQTKYLPMMREAVKQGKAKPDQLALLEDRVLTNQGKPQLYGSQVRTGKNGKYEFFPIADEKNVNQRRAEMGLEPLEQYARYYNIDYHVPK